MALSSLAINLLTKPGRYYVGKAPNLTLVIKKSGARSWVLRYSFAGRRCDMGLGSYPEVSISEARNIALDKRHLLRQGIDPITQRQENLAKFKRKNGSSIQFKEAAKRYIEAHRAGWKNQKHAEQWCATLEKYAYPVIGGKFVRDITIQNILDIIEPIWTAKTETAKRVQGRIENILDWCKTKGYREGDNPAVWRGNLSNLLASPNKVKKVKHHEALDWNECPEFFNSLSQRQGVSIEALKLCILTGCRSNEVRGATWAEFNLDNALWIIPAERMKAVKEHRVPLSPPAIALLKKLPRFEDVSWVFPSSKATPLCDMALLKVIRGTGSKFTVHGFRSSFRDWAGESTNHSREVIEHALAHQLKDKAEAAYARGDLLAKRRLLMNDWADFLTTGKQQHPVAPNSA
jgi:integrase